MRGTRPGRRIAFALGALACLSGASCGDEASPATPAELDAFRQAAGRLAAAETTALPDRGRYAAERVWLRGTGGLVATGRILRPREGSGCYAAALLQNGREENSEVVGRLPEDFGDVVVLALDYPSEFPYSLTAGDLLKSGRLERPAREIPALFLLGAQYLASRTDVDTNRIVLAATSFAVPFATIAAAAEPLFANVALIYGAGDLPGVVAANLRDVPRPLRRPAAAFALRRFAPLAPERYIAMISPRPVVMVNGADDPQMPADAVTQLYERAMEPKSLVWLRTGHLMPTDSALIRTLIDTALARLPALHDTTASAGCRS